MKFFLLISIFISCFIYEMNCFYDCKSHYDCTALDDYVAKEDEHYSWFDTGEILQGVTIDGKNFTANVLNMTSQQWLTDEDSDHSIWWHIVAIVIPEDFSSSNYQNWGNLWIATRSNEGSGIPGATDDNLVNCATVATMTNTICATIFQVPNQPIVFTEDPVQESRKEDAVIAYTWDHFLKDPSDTRWPLRLPMTKAAVRAIDTASAYLMSKNYKELDSFIVAGESKRGWTTWMVPLVDERVKGIAPIVMDALNLDPNLHHQYKAYGGWTLEFYDYWVMNITARLDIPNTRLLWDIVDPYSYLPRYQDIAKLVIDGGMDEFFLPDDSLYWWNDMPGTKNLMMMPNDDHGQNAPSYQTIVPSIATWAQMLHQGKKDDIPQPKWEIDQVSGDITLDVNESKYGVKKVTKWTATTCNDKRRDFRLLNADSPCTCGQAQDDGSCLNLRVFWHSEVVEETEPGSGIYIAHEDIDESGKWTAFFMEIKYDNSLYDNLGWPLNHYGHFDVTTGTSIIPNTFPFPDCYGEECFGDLV